ncbi:hypothetical protein ACFWOB_36955 [Streptomyces sp. NPDC058420]
MPTHIAISGQRQFAVGDALIYLRGEDAAWRRAIINVLSSPLDCDENFR